MYICIYVYMYICIILLLFSVLGVPNGVLPKGALEFLRDSLMVAIGIWKGVTGQINWSRAPPGTIVLTFLIYHREKQQ